jgi:subtilisin family serine protease
VSVWVAFRDKGEDGPADLARRLAEAEAGLEPRARARRLRAKVTPLVDYLDLPVYEPYVEALGARGLAPYGASRWFNRVAVRAPGSQLAPLAELPFVARLEPVERGEPMRDVPASPLAERAASRTGIERVDADYGLTASQLSQIGVPALHDSGYTGKGVLVCLLDDGFNYWNVHPALSHARDSVLATRDFVRGTYDPTDTVATCRHVIPCFTYDASFALGRTEVDSTEHAVEMVYWGMGAEWADSLGADIISSSLGYNTFDAPDPSYTYADMNGHTTIISRAAEIAASKGILVVNSAGNSGCASPAYCWYYVIAPADVNGDSLIAAGSVDQSGNLAFNSSRGPTADGRVKPDLAARGVEAWVVRAHSSGFVSLSGTSFSCPLIAGLAACLMQAQPSWPPVLIIRALRLTASRATDPNNQVGYGIPDGAAALHWIRDTGSIPGLPPFNVSLRLAGPNPITPSAPQTLVLFGLGAGAGAGAPRLQVLDAQGRLVVRGLGYRRSLAGAREGLDWAATWDGRSDDGRLLRGGLYFIMLEARGHRAMVRLVSLR